jgi:hypothetical protein
MRVFLAFSFRDEDKILVTNLQRLIESHRVEVITGERLGGEQLTPGVQQRIEECDALVALLTYQKKPDGTYTTSNWVREELVYARAKNKKAIALVEENVDLGGMFASHEIIPFARESESLTESILRLSETIAEWMREVGRHVKVQILPQEIAKQLAHEDGGVRCSYRLWLKNKTWGSWFNVTPLAEDDGRTFVWVNNVQDDHLVQIRVELSNEIWSSPATTQWMLVTLSQGSKK